MVHRGRAAPVHGHDTLGSKSAAGAWLRSRPPAPLPAENRFAPSGPAAQRGPDVGSRCRVPPATCRVCRECESMASGATTRRDVFAHEGAAWGLSPGGPGGCSCGPSSPPVPLPLHRRSPCISDSMTTWPVRARSARPSCLGGSHRLSSLTRNDQQNGTGTGGEAGGTSACNGLKARRAGVGLQPGPASPGRPRAQDGFGDKAAERRGQWSRSATSVQEGPIWSPFPLTFSLRRAPGREPGWPLRDSAAAFLRAVEKVERGEFREQTVLIKQTNEFIASVRY